MIYRDPIAFAHNLGESAGQDYYGPSGTESNWQRVVYNLAVPWAGIENDIDRAFEAWRNGCRGKPETPPVTPA